MPDEGEASERRARDAADAACVARIAEKDPRALGELYDRHAGLALGLALRIVRDRGEAEDIVHDVFVAVWERAGQFSAARGNVASWLVATVRNLAVDRSRRRTRRARIGDEELRHEPKTLAASPEDLSIEAREATDVRGALARLAPAQRATLEIAFFEGLTYAEIAARENVPLGTVKSRAARALAALREALELPAKSTGSPLTDGTGVR